MRDFWVYFLLMAGSTYLIRALPFALMTRKIENRYVRSFLYYIPYTVLAVMTLPGGIYATASPICGLLGLLSAALVAFKRANLTLVAFVASATALLASFLF